MCSVSRSAARTLTTPDCLRIYSCLILLSNAPDVRWSLACRYMGTGQSGSCPHLRDFLSLQALPCRGCLSWTLVRPPRCTVPPAPASAPGLPGRCRAGEQPLQQAGGPTVRCCLRPGAGGPPPSEL